MIEFVLAAAAQQATGIPAEVWIAIIGAISGSLIKPVFDLISQRITAQKDADEEASKAANEIKERLIAEIEELKKSMREMELAADDDVQSARKREDEWREKYYATMERFNSIYSQPPKVEQRLDLSDPGVLKQVIKQITEN